jgi:transposase
VKEPVRALEIYRNKDMAEKAFGDLKERLGARRMLVSSESSLNGKLFVEFIALIFLSYIKKTNAGQRAHKEQTSRPCSFPSNLRCLAGTLAIQNIYHHGIA